MQISAGAALAGKNKLAVCHPVEILDDLYRCAGLYEKVVMANK